MHSYMPKEVTVFFHTDAAYAGIGPRVHSKEECLDGGMSTQQVAMIRSISIKVTF